MIEKRYLEVPPQALTANGNSDGLIQVADATLYKVKQEVRVFSNTVSPIVYEVKRISSATQLHVGLKSLPISKYSNTSLFLVADSAMISAPDQERPTISNYDSMRAVYDEEPTVALRSILVDKLGNRIDASNPLPTSATLDVGDISIETALDAFTKTPPDNVIAVGTSDGTLTGTKKALKIGADNKAEVKDTAADASLVAIDTKLGSPLPLPIGASTEAKQDAEIVKLTAIDSKLGAPLPLPTGASTAANQATQITELSAINTAQTDGSQKTQVTSSALPTGASTAANQATEIAELSAINTAQTDGSQKTQVTSSALPTGAATAANQATEIASLGSIDGKLNSLGQKTKAGSVPVTFPSDADPVKTIQVFTKAFDAITRTYPDPSPGVEVYQSRVGGDLGTIQQTATVTYADGAPKQEFLKVVVV